MNYLKGISLGLAVAFIGSTMNVQPGFADDFDLITQARGGGGGGKGGGGGGKGGDGGDGGSTVRTPTLHAWMDPEIQLAWDHGYFGQNTTITVVDDFTSRTKLFGNLGEGLSRSRHGEWTLQQAGMIATSATMVANDFYSGDALTLGDGFNVINLSYGYVGLPGEISSFSDFRLLEQSIINYAIGGEAFVAKSAGNDSIAVGDMITAGAYAGQYDYLSQYLVGAEGVIFVGALDHVGSVDNQATLAGYSNFAGDDLTVQSQFLVVGVEDGITGLAGTSFAAPIISGYAAVLSSKFNTDSGAMIADRLLDTARTDTLAGYNAFTYGQGEASIYRAIAPDGMW